MEAQPGIDVIESGMDFLISSKADVDDHHEMQPLTQFAVRDSNDELSCHSSQHLPDPSSSLSVQTKTPQPMEKSHNDADEAEVILIKDNDDDDEDDDHNPFANLLSSNDSVFDIFLSDLQKDDPFSDVDQVFHLRDIYPEDIFPATELTAPSGSVQNDDTVMGKHVRASSTSWSSGIHPAVNNETNSWIGSLDMAGYYESTKKASLPTIGDSDETTATTATDDTISEDTLYFGFHKHPATKIWREIIREYSENFIDFPNWVDRIGTEIMRRLQKQGIRQFKVHEVKNKVDRHRGKFDLTLGEWRLATHQEFFARTKQRFKDNRKELKKASLSNHIKRPVGRPRKNLWSDNKRAPIREPCYNITERTVCIGWNVHPGTKKWREVLKMFSRNTEKYPEWSDDISFLVKSRLALEFYTPFIVSQDEEGNRCEPGSNGLWVLATDEEILEVNKHEFYVQRREDAGMVTKGV